MAFENFLSEWIYFLSECHCPVDPGEVYAFNAYPANICADGVSYTTIIFTLWFDSTPIPGILIKFETTYGNFFDQTIVHGKEFNTQTNSQGKAIAHLRSVSDYKGEVIVTASFFDFYYYEGDSFEQIIGFIDTPAESLIGRIFDSEGKAIHNTAVFINRLYDKEPQGNMITLENMLSDPYFITNTNSAGKYSIDLPNDKYTIIIAKEGYVTYARTVDIIGEGQRIDVVVNNQIGSHLKDGENSIEHSNDSGQTIELFDIRFPDIPEGKTLILSCLNLNCTAPAPIPEGKRILSLVEIRPWNSSFESARLRMPEAKQVYYYHPPNNTWVLAEMEPDKSIDPNHNTALPTKGGLYAQFSPENDQRTSISGRVINIPNPLDPNRALNPITNASVHCSGSSRMAITDDLGRFELDNVPLGTNYFTILTYQGNVTLNNEKIIDRQASLVTLTIAEVDPWLPPEFIIISANPQKIIANPITLLKNEVEGYEAEEWVWFNLNSSDITAYIKDELSNPVVDGTIVTFIIDPNTSTTEAMISPATTVTENGWAKAVLTPSTKTGNICIKTSCGAKSEIINIDLAHGPPTNVKLSYEGGVMRPNGADSVVVNADLSDIYGNSVGKNMPVVFALVSSEIDPNTGLALTYTMGSITPAAITDDTGRAQAIFTAGTRSGTVIVIAAPEGNLANSGMMPLTIIDIVPAQISASARPTVLIANTESTSTITVQVKDENGTPVGDGTPVSFSLTAEVPGGVVTNTAVTNGGVAQGTYISPSTTGVERGRGYVTIKVQAGPVSDFVELTLCPGIPSTITLETFGTLIPEGETPMTIVATVADQFGNVLDILLGLLILDATLGLLESRGGGTGDTYDLTAGPEDQGVSIITAMIGDIKTSIAVAISKVTPHEIAVITNPVEVVADGVSTSNITAQVTDLRNNAVPDGTPVAFNVALGSVGGIITHEGITSGGIAHAVYTAPETTGVLKGKGVVTIKARVGMCCGSADLYLIPGPPGIIEFCYPGVLRPNPQTTQ